MINKQQHKTTCGPVAIVNALRWMGYCNTYDEMVEFAKEHLDFKHRGFKHPREKQFGVCYSQLQLGLKTLGIKHKLIRKATLSDVTKALNEGKAVILRFQWNRKYGHYVFIDKHTKKFVRAWNFLDKKNKTPIVSKSKLRKRITYTNRQYALRKIDSATHAFIITPDATG